MFNKCYCSIAGYKYVRVSVLTDLSRFRPVYAPKDFLEVSPVSFSTAFNQLSCALTAISSAHAASRCPCQWLNWLWQDHGANKSMFNSYLIWIFISLTTEVGEKIVSLFDLAVRHTGVDQPAQPESQQQRGCGHQKPLGPHSSPAQCPGHPAAGRLTPAPHSPRCSPPTPIISMELNPTCTDSETKYLISH